MSGILRTISSVASVAVEVVGADQHVALDRVRRGRRAPWPARGGSAAATCDLGTAACTLAATEPRGGTSGWNSWPTLARALAIEMTTLPCSWRGHRLGRGRGRVPRRGDDDDVGVRPRPRCRRRRWRGLGRPTCSSSGRGPPSRGTSTASRARPRIRPKRAERPSRCRPDLLHQECRSARRATRSAKRADRRCRRTSGQRARPRPGR